MNKLIISLAAAILSLPVAADEGMWLLPLLKGQKFPEMQALGLKLQDYDIYSPDSASLKDAVVIFGGGCTGEIVSPEGLLLTNHHCGYGCIQRHSTLEHDYLTDGFWAMSRDQELPNPGMTVTFIDKIEDVTNYVKKELEKDTDPNSMNFLSPKFLNGLAKAKVGEKFLQDNPGTEVEIKAFYGGNQYFMFTKKIYSDIRLVGAPPSSIGKFGADTDNWMWPRHTGDFSVFRVYAGQDNRPADYSPENRPYKAEKFLKISLDGYKEGDFAMIMGFPGSTQRYMTSYEIDDMLNVSNPNRIFIRGERQAILKEDMAASDKVRIQYASKYATSSNYWKNSIGKSRGILKLGVKERKQQQEAAFQAWAEKNTLPEEGYIDALPKIREAIEGLAGIDDNRQYLEEAFLRAVEILTPAKMFDGRTEIKYPEEARKAMAGWYKDYNAPTDRKVAKRMLKIAREHMTDLPSFYTEIVDKEFNGDTDAYVDYIFDNSLFTSQEKVDELIGAFSADKYAADPIAPFVKSVWEKYNALSQARKPVVEKYYEGSRKYVAGLMLQNPKKAWASDANFTLRLTYGRVLPYSPADGIEYNYYTTLKGVMEKENPQNPTEFTVPEKLKELYAARDFGRYANAGGELPVAFLADCDITGGNSGSPVMNARGALLGLAFDGNWEAMSGDVAFEPDLQRTISVDIRYVLFIIDKFAGAGWLLDELVIE